MNPDHDFSRTPRQRQRRRETRFYGALGGSAALTAVAVLALGGAIEDDSTQVHASVLMLQAELQQLQPRLTQVTALEATIVTQQEHLASQVGQAMRRAFAPHTLQALATISPAHIRLQQIVVRVDEAEIRGTASGQRQLQDLLDALKSSGLGQVRLQDMQQKNPQDPLATPRLPYSFTLTLSNSAPTLAPAPAPAPAPPPATTPSLPSRSEAAQVQRARRT